MNPVTHAMFALTRVADGYALGGERRVVVGDPGLSLFGVEERERQRADAVLRRQVDGLASGARDPHGGMRLLDRLGHHVARRHAHVLAGEARERLLGHAAQRDPKSLLPHLTLLLGIDPERVELGGGGAFSGPELDPTARHEVERRDALGLASRVVDGGRAVHDPVPEPDVLGAL